MWKKTKLVGRWLFRPHIIIAAFASAFIALDLLFKPLTWVTVTLIVIALLPWFLAYIKSIELIRSVELPGGVKLDLSKKLDTAADKAREAGLLEEEAPVEEVQDRLSSQYLRDPTLALAALRIDLERRLRRLADLSVGSNHSSSGTTRRPLGLTRLIEDLQANHVISQLESSAIRDVVPALNAAVHAEVVTPETAEWIIDFGPRLLAALDAKIRGIEALQEPALA
ncbi:MAG: hypothetical protein Q7T68_13560 [Sphingopyxis sp.]|nr:hypothetical protein [Sphingopyxis sp.]